MMEECTIRIEAAAYPDSTDAVALRDRLTAASAMATMLGSEMTTYLQEVDRVPTRAAETARRQSADPRSCTEDLVAAACGLLGKHIPAGKSGDVRFVRFQLADISSAKTESQSPSKLLELMGHATENRNEE
jgi:hypothetical protein